MSWKGGSGYFVEGSIQKSYLPLKRQAFQEASVTNFLCPNCGLLTETLNSSLLPTTKSLDIDNCCIAWATITLTHLHTFVWAMLLGHDLETLPWQQSFHICFHIWLLSPSFEVSQQAWPERDFIPEGRVGKSWWWITTLFRIWHSQTNKVFRKRSSKFSSFRCLYNIIEVICNIERNCFQ